jgi:Xaa-Pro aminopeptidase
MSLVVGTRPAARPRPAKIRRVPDQVLIYADTVRSPEMRHEVPVTVPDPFVYLEVNGDRHIVGHTMELARLGHLGAQLHPFEEFGIDALVREGRSLLEIYRELNLRACKGIGVTAARVPFWFPVDIADHLRANGIELTPDREFFNARRRAKNAFELEGVRRAQRAAEAGMETARQLLVAAEPNGDGLVLDGEPLTVERVKAAMTQTFIEHDCTTEEFIVAPGAQGAVGHDMGSGPIRAGEPLIIDVFPRDLASTCFADMTRTFVVGEPPAEIAEWQVLVREAVERSIAAVRPGATGREVFDISCDVFEEHGHPTLRTKEIGKPLRDGFFHSLGHGVGLEVHEEPSLGMVGEKTLVPGDVVTIEPGLYRQGFGGVRLEDLVLVTEDGHENLTQFPYDLQP